MSVVLGMPLLAAATSVQQTSPVGNGTLIAYPDEQVIFTNWGGPYLSTVVEKRFTKVAPLNFDLSYTAQDLQAGGFGGIRLVELVHNDTALTWTDFHVSFDPTVAIWRSGAPGLIPDAYVVQLQSGTSDDWQATDAPNVANLVVGASSVDFYFKAGQEIQPGGSFGLYIAFTPSLSDGTIHVSENPTVPLPAAAWAGMALLGGLGVMRKLRRAV
jgi:hypothetical protein